MAVAALAFGLEDTPVYIKSMFSDVNNLYFNLGIKFSADKIIIVFTSITYWSLQVTNNASQAN